MATDDFNGDVREALANTPPPPEEDVAQLARQEAGRLSRRLRRAALLTRATVVACVLFGLFCYLELRGAGSGEVRKMLGWAVLILIMYESTVLMKLWYWVVNTRINIQKDLKEVQIQLAALREQMQGGSQGESRRT